MRFYSLYIFTFFSFLFNSNPQDNYTSKFDTITNRTNITLNQKVAVEKEFSYQFSFGPGVGALGIYKPALYVLGFEMDYRRSKNFILISGIDLLFDVNDFLNVENTKISANLFFAPALFYESKFLKFYAGIGAAVNVPNLLISSIFIIGNIGMKTSEVSSIDFSIKVPNFIFYWRQSNPQILSLHYTVEF